MLNNHDQPLKTLCCHKAVAAAYSHHQNKHRVCTGNMKPLAIIKVNIPPLLPPASTLSNNTTLFMLLNSHSLNNLASFIHDVISDHIIDFLCLMETWQNLQDLRDSQWPPGYIYLHKPCSKMWLPQASPLDAVQVARLIAKAKRSSCFLEILPSAFVKVRPTFSFPDHCWHLPL